MKNTFILIPLVICLSLLVGYNFMSAQWSVPSAVAPNGNTPAPINVGPVTQSKTGNFMANVVAAVTSTWSPRYCDETGNNCWDPATGNSGSSNTVTIGGICFEPTYAVGCMWNWGGTGNDTSIFYGPLSINPVQICANVGRVYVYYNVVLEQCS